MPPEVVLLNYMTVRELVPKLGFFAGFSIHTRIINFAGRISEVKMGGVGARSAPFCVLLNTKMPPILLLLRQAGCVCTESPLFRKLVSKNVYVSRAVWYLLNRRGRRLAQYFAEFFQQIGRKVFIQPVCRRGRRIGCFCKKWIRTLNMD